MNLEHRDSSDYGRDCSYGGGGCNHTACKAHNSGQKMMRGRERRAREPNV